jgi:type I restriction enzyme S subunit
MKSGQYTEINYIDIASVKGGQILELQKLTNDFPSRAKRIVKKGDILYSSVRPNLKGYVYISDDIQNGIASTGFADIRVKEPNTILSRYLYYIMTSDYISDDLISKAKGAQYPAVSFVDFETIKIPVPSFERQKEIVEYCEYNDTLIKQLEKEIENNKKQAQQFITGIVKAQVQIEEKKDIEEDTETSSINTEPNDEVVEKKEPITKPNNTCPYIFTKGSNKGNQCNCKPKNGAVYCSKHKKYEVTANRNINKDNLNTEFIIEEDE